MKARQEAARELLSRRAARTSLLEFTRYGKPDYEVNWHHRLIAEHLDALAEGRIRRLMIFTHPRSGKTELASRRLPAYFLGRNPDSNIIACSYSADLTGRINRDVQRIIDQDDYRILFPEVRLFGKNVRTLASGTWMRNSDFFEVVGRRGSYRSTGVGGGVTGMGADLILVDDPLKSAADARSPAIRDSQWEWFNSDLYTRQAPNCRILIINTRWHHDDICGRLLKQAASDPNADQWTVLRLPAIAEEAITHPADPRKPGEALWPSRFGLSFLEKTRAQLGPYAFGSLYQQNPTPREGGLFTAEGLSQIVAASPRQARRVRYWDKGYSSEGDFTAGVRMARAADGRYYIEDIVRGRWTPHERNARIRLVAETDRQQYGPVLTLIEQPPGAGSETTETLVRLLAGYPVRAVRPRGDKAERAEPLADQVEAGNVLLVRGAWNAEFVSECLMFPAGANDDQVDGATGAFTELSRPGPGHSAAGGNPSEMASGPPESR